MSISSQLRPTRALFTRYATAWVYLVAFTVAEIAYALLSPHDQAAVVGWASTNVHNLHHDPIGCMIASAFVTQEFAAAWPALIALAMFGANRVLGNWRTALVCIAGQVIGTLVSEGIEGYRVSHGLLPPADRYIVDVGPSYVVVSAIAVAVLYGPWLARAAAALDLFLLVYVGNIFGGLSTLQVSAVGHVTAIAVAVVLGSLLFWQMRRRLRRQLLSEAPAHATTG
jgi:membrane associated rhomboid family serine protease